MQYYNQLFKKMQDPQGLHAMNNTIKRYRLIQKRSKKMNRTMQSPPCKYSTLYFPASVPLHLSHRTQRYRNQNKEKSTPRFASMMIGLDHRDSYTKAIPGLPISPQVQTTSFSYTESSFQKQPSRGKLYFLFPRSFSSSHKELPLSSHQR